MKLQTPNNYLKSRALILYKPETTIGKTPDDKSESLKVDIKTQPKERYSKTVAIYVPLFRTGGPEALLKFLMLLNKIIRGQYLYTGPHKFGMTRNLIAGEALWVFDQKAWDMVTETNANYKLVMKYVITYFFPPKALQHQKRYPRRGM